MAAFDATYAALDVEETKPETDEHQHDRAAPSSFQVRHRGADQEEGTVTG